MTGDDRALRRARLTAQVALGVVGVGAFVLVVLGGLALSGITTVVLDLLRRPDDPLATSDGELGVGLLVRGFVALMVCGLAAWLLGQRPRAGALLTLLVAGGLVWWGALGLGWLAWLPALVLAVVAARVYLVSEGPVAGPGVVAGPPRVLVVEHEADAPVAWFGMWLAEADAVLDVRRPYEAQPMPTDLDDVDALVVMGGAMGAGDDARFPWLRDVKQLIRLAAQEGVPVLGICLGHQLSAVALGGEIAVNARGKQVGLLDVGWSADAADDPLFSAVATPRRGLHWNDDVVVVMPDQARRMATAPGGEVQAARFADSVWGVQWHPEVDHQIVGLWVHDEGLPDGLDPDDELGALRQARPELDRAWRPLAHRLVDLARARAGLRAREAAR